MVTRRALLRGTAGAATAAGSAALAGLAGCRSRPESQPPAGDVLLIETADGVALLDTRRGLRVRPGPGLRSGDGNRLVRTRAVAQGTELAGYDAQTGQLVTTATLAGGLRARAVSPDGRLVALTEADAGQHTRTTLVVAGPSGERLRHELAGNLEPDAFAASGEQLFVLDHLPTAAPDRYRVRSVDLASGRIGPVLTRTKALVPDGAEEEMRGERRQAGYDRRHGQLLTLYTHQRSHLHTRDLLGARRDAPGVHAFVHVLNLGQGWAFCIDLPAEFGVSAGGGYALALAQRGTWAAAVDTAAGLVTVLNTTDLTVTRTVKLPPTRPDTATSAVDIDGNLVVGTGAEVVLLSPVEDGGGQRWQLPGPVRGLAPATGQVYAGQPDGVVRLDLHTGKITARVPVPGMLRLAPAA